MDDKIIKSKYLNSLSVAGKIPYLFIGSGFTKRYCDKALSWNELLNSLASIIGISDFQMQSMRINLEKDNTAGIVNQKIASFLNSSLIEKINKGEASSIFTTDEQKIIVDNKIDPFKFLVAKIVNIDSIPSSFPTEKYKNKELRLFKKLRKNIPGIITTNYDSLIELLFDNEYKTFIKQQDYFYSENYNNAEIYKIHGSVADPNTLVITEDDYNNFNAKSFLTTSKLLQILSNNPIVFIGYSLNDEDIKAIISNLISCLDEEQIKNLEKNLLFINWKYHVRLFKESQSEFLVGNKRLYLPTITTDNYTDLYEWLTHFKVTLSPAEIRKYQSALAKLISTNDKKLPIVFTNINLETANYDENQRFVSSVGTSPKAEAKYSIKDIIHNYLHERRKFSKASILEWTKSYFNSVYWVPLYAYLDINKEPSLNAFKQKKEAQIETMQKNLKKTKQISNIEDLESEDKTQKKLKIIIKSLLCNSLDYKKAKKYLKDLYLKDNDTITIHEFKVCVTLVSKLESEQKNRVSK